MQTAGVIMTHKSNKLPKFRIRDAFTWERVICRLIASWCVFAAYSLHKVEGDFFSLSFAQEKSFTDLILTVALVFAICSIANAFFSRFETDTWVLMLFSTACVTFWLYNYENSTNRFLFGIAVTAVYSLFVIYFVNKNTLLWNIWKPGNKTVIIASIVCGIVCGGVIAAITCLRYMTFSSPNFDFGLFVNMFHNMKETGLPLSTSERDVLLTHFAVHISPIYYLILPFYCLFPSPLTLQIAQAVVLASGVVPVVLLCKHFKLSGKATLLVTFIYSLYPALSAGCFYDIHENCFLAPLLLWLFYFFEREKPIPMYISAIAVLMVKEDAAVYVVIFAIFIILSRKKYLHGSILAVGALIYFAIALNVLEATATHYAELYADQTPNPSIGGPMINRFNNLIVNKEEGLLGALKTALVNPGYLLTQLFTTSDNGWNKLTYFIQILLPLGFIPFCTKKISRYLLIAPILMNLLTNYQYQYNINFQYHFGIIAFFIYVTVMNIPDMKTPQRRTLISIGTAACLCLYMVSVIPNLKKYDEKWKDNKETYQKMEEILDTIPDDASVACSSMLLAHIADRNEIYELNYHGNEGNVDLIIYDLRYKIDEEQYKSFIDQGYTVKEKHDGMILILHKPQ